MCAPSLALPAIRRGSDEHARAGHIKHGFVRSACVRGRSAALAEVEAVDSDLAEWCSRVELGELARLGTIDDAEVAYAYDVETGEARIVGRNLGRAYGPLGPNEIPTTTDLEIIGHDGVRTLWDIKTGWMDVPPDTPQIRFHSLVSMAARGEDTNRAGILRITDEGKLEPRRPLILDRLDAGAMAHDLREACARVLAARALVASGGTPSVNPGDWCHFCESAGACPAQVGLARAVLGLDADVASRFATLTSEELGELWVKAEAASKFLKAIDEGLKTCARQEPLVLPDGSTVQMVEITKRCVNHVPKPDGSTYSYWKATTRKPPKGARQLREFAAKQKRTA